MKCDDKFLNTTLTVAMFRSRGLCVQGLRKSAGTLGFSFKELVAGKIQVKDVLPHQDNIYIKEILKEIEDGRW